MHVPQTDAARRVIFIYFPKRKHTKNVQLEGGERGCPLPMSCAFLNSPTRTPFYVNGGVCACFEKGGCLKKNSHLLPTRWLKVVKVSKKSGIFFKKKWSYS